VAITRDIILSETQDGVAVIFRGIKAGMLEDGEFIADHERSPLGKRVLYKLVEEGVI